MCTFKLIYYYKASIQKASYNAKINLIDSKFAFNNTGLVVNYNLLYV